jgi:flavin reductase (DIM6/NTAB) family NADH-FMN oxidoreductase RutF
MLIDFHGLTPSQVYFNLIQTLIPRPIAWVLSENSDQSYNLAPFSYFSAVCSNPPLLMISVGKKPDGSHKDTRVNIEQRRDFVVHIAHQGMLEELNESSATLPANVSEVDRLGLATETFDGFQLPRLTGCHVAYGCECYEIQEIGSAPQSLIFGRINRMYVDDTICSEDTKGRIKVDAKGLDPLGRLGASEYATLGEIIHLGRPK